MVLPVAAAVAAEVAARTGAKVAGNLIGAVSRAIKNGSDIGSLADLARPARVEPIVMIDKGLQNQPFMEDVMKMTLTSFTAYYMQALSMLQNVGRIDTLKVFDSLNPHRSVGDYGIKDAVFSAEAYKDGLPSLEAFKQKAPPKLLATISTEAEDSPQTLEGEYISVSDKSVEKIYEIDNLAVGKLVNVELRDGDAKAKIPVLIRLIPAAVPAQSLVHIFTAAGRQTWGERYQLWRAGQISLVRDLMLGIDLLDDYRKALVNDKSGTMMAITDRRRNNVQKAALTGKVSMADASNIAVVSKETAKQMGQALYGKLDMLAVRNKIFDNSYLLMLIVVDEQWERVTVYHRGMDLATDYSFKEIKATEKGKGPDITELFKAFHQTLAA
jgi:hypothetical protein